MADVKQIQSNMNRGELDPLLAGRQDLQTYYAGVQTAKNVLCLPQGGLKKRPGTNFLIDVTLEGNGRIENFSFSTEQNYVLYFSHLKMMIFKDNILMTNINGSGLPYLGIPYTVFQIYEFDYIQSADTAIILHKDVAPMIITRTGHTSWTIAAITFTWIPQYDFNDALSPFPTSEVQDITFTNANEGDRYRLALDGILSDDIVFAGDDATNQSNIQKALVDLPNTPFDAGITVVATVPLTTYRITFLANCTDAWPLMTGAAVYTLNTNFQVTTTRAVTGVSKREDTWSANRGWPSCGTFHEGRLWLAGSTYRPAALWGSRPFDFFNFYSEKGLDDEGIEVTIDTDQVNAIQRIFSNRSLQIFTTGGEFYVKESPITPENVAVSPQSNFGSKAVRPVTIDGATLFIQRTGKSILQFIYLDEYQANQTKNISVIASHLIKDPIKLAVSRGSENTDANYVYILNDDGTMTVYNSLSAEEVQGFTQWIIAPAADGSGSIKSICVTDNTLYMLTQRNINSVPVTYIEYENIAANTDCTRTDFTNDDEITGLTHLEGETVWTKADGAFMGEYTVSGGLVTLVRTSASKEAGLAFVPEIVTMPLNVNTANGPNANVKKKIARVALQLYQSNGVLVNGQRIADKTIGTDQFDPPSPRTGLVRKHILGWSLEAQVTITQDTPMPLTLLSIGVDIAL